MTKTAAVKSEIGPVNAFIGQKTKPTQAEVEVALGKAYVLWKKLITDLGACGIDAQEWGSYSVKAGWSLRLKRGDRVIVYFVPCRDRFWVSFALGAKAIEAARKAKLPSRIEEVIGAARKYAEGTAVRFEVAAADVDVVKKLVRAKIEN
jgi:hypothetical protein